MAYLYSCLTTRNSIKPWYPTVFANQQCSYNHVFGTVLVNKIVKETNMSSESVASASYILIHHLVEGYTVEDLLVFGEQNFRKRES